MSPVYLVDANEVRRPRLGELYVDGGRLKEATPNRLAEMPADAEYPIASNPRALPDSPATPAPVCHGRDGAWVHTGTVVPRTGGRYCSDCYGL